MNSKDFVKLVQCLDDGCLFLVVHNTKERAKYIWSVLQKHKWSALLRFSSIYISNLLLLSPRFTFCFSTASALSSSWSLYLWLWHTPFIHYSIYLFVVVCQLIFSLYHLQLPLKNKYLNINSNRCQNLFSFQQAVRGWFCHRMSHFCDLVLKC